MQGPAGNQSVGVWQSPSFSSLLKLENIFVLLSIFSVTGDRKPTWKCLRKKGIFGSFLELEWVREGGPVLNLTASE